MKQKIIFALKIVLIISLAITAIILRTEIIVNNNLYAVVIAIILGIALYFINKMIDKVKGKK